MKHMIRRDFLSSLLAFALVTPVHGTVTSSSRVLYPWWNARFSPFNPRLPDGSPGDDFIFVFLWQKDGAHRWVTQNGGTIFVDGKEIDLLSTADKAEFPDIFSTYQEAWHMAIDKVWDEVWPIDGNPQYGPQ